MSSWQGPVVLRQDTGACCGRDRLRAPTAQTPRRYAVGNLDPGMLCRPSPDVEGVNAWRSWGGNGPSSIGRKVLCLWHLRRNRAWAMASGTRLRRVRVGHCCEPVGPIGQKPAGAMDHPAQVLAAGRRRLLRAAAGPDSSQPRFGATLTLATAGQVELPLAGGPGERCVSSQIVAVGATPSRRVASPRLRAITARITARRVAWRARKNRLWASDRTWRLCGSLAAGSRLKNGSVSSRVYFDADWCPET